MLHLYSSYDQMNIAFNQGLHYGLATAGESAEFGWVRFDVLHEWMNEWLFALYLLMKIFQYFAGRNIFLDSSLSTRVAALDMGTPIWTYIGFNG